MKSISRSSIETFLSDCRRKGYLRYIYKGTGFNAPPNSYLVVGLTVHGGMEYLFRSGGDLSFALGKAEEEFLSQLRGTTLTADWKEHLSLSKALIIGWYHSRWADFNQRFEVISIEKEVKSLLAPNVTLNARCDLVVRERATGYVFVINWKTHQDKTGFSLKWNEEVQSWTEALVTQDVLGEEIQGCIFFGFYKGGVSTAAAHKGRSNSPLLRCFVHEDGSTSFESESGKLWKRVDQSDNIEAWILGLPKEVLDAQFAESPPIFKNDDIVREWLDQVIRFVTDAQRVLEEDVPERDRLAFFNQSFSNYKCGKCEFRPVCFKEYSVEDLVEMGRLMERVDHHAPSLA